MVKKSLIWGIVLIVSAGMTFLAAGCSKKTILKEEAGGKPVMEAKKATPPPAPKMEPPKAPPPPAPAPKVEAAPAPKMEAAPAPFDLAGNRIQFAFDDYSLSAKSKENLEKIARWMKSESSSKVQIQGNTCDIGTSEYNLALGDRRAVAAKAYIAALGVDASRLTTISYGEEKPRVPNSDEANRSLNRRDDFAFVK